MTISNILTDNFKSYEFLSHFRLLRMEVWRDPLNEILKIQEITNW